jgi:hypothetical protein
MKKEDRPLKVCHTCRNWSYKLKGYCLLMEQGVGRFWVCEDWLAREEGKNAPEAAPGPSRRE